MMNSDQSTSRLLMIRPARFGFNLQTAESNAFQTPHANSLTAQEKALKEFDGMVATLRDHGIEVTVFEDSATPEKPDAVFPNNWVSFHADGTVLLYPMQAENRRLERRDDIISDLKKSFNIKAVTDLSRFELENKFLEGTGSMVLDRQNKIAYACISPRTSPELLAMFCRQLGYKQVSMHAADKNGQAIYHTNVLMCIGTGFAVICLDSIIDDNERNEVTTILKLTHKEIISISFEQMNHFAGNMLEVQNVAGERLIVMSQTAFNILNNGQKKCLEKFGKLIKVDIHTIESIGGGSARCMMAELHLPILVHS